MYFEKRVVLLPRHYKVYIIQRMKLLYFIHIICKFPSELLLPREINLIIPVLMFNFVTKFIRMHCLEILLKLEFSIPF